TGKKTGPGRFEVKATVAADSHTSAVIIPQERNADPAYALIELNDHNPQVDLSITILEPGKNKPASRWVDPEIIRLLALILLGAVIYTITAFLLQIPEVQKSWETIKS